MSEPTWYDASHPTVVQAGSLVFCQSPDFIGAAIRWGQRLRWKPAARWNHVAMTTEEGANPPVVQATVDGVTGDRTLSTLEGGPVLVVPPPMELDIERSISFAKLQVGDPYGYLTLLGIVVDQLSPHWLRFQIGRYGSWICSALGAECWRAGGWLTNWPDIYDVAPAQLALAVGVDPSLVYPTKKGTP
jgi:hypothetical protein